MRRVCRLLGLGGVVFFMISAFSPLPNLLSRWMSTPSRLEPAQAIVVLGGGIFQDGMLSTSSLRRALHGISLHRKGLAPLLVFLGPARGAGLVEAEIRAELARELGVSPAAILTVTEAWTTRQEAVRVRALLEPRGARRILLVTDSRHLARAGPLFERAGFEVVAAPADSISSAQDSPQGRLELTRQVLQELAARFYYRVAGYL